jgi:hypothetical protein
MAVILPRGPLSNSNLAAGLRLTPSSRRRWKVSRKDLMPVTPPEGAKPGFQSNAMVSPGETAGQAPEISATGAPRGKAGAGTSDWGACAKAQANAIPLRLPRMAFVRVEDKDRWITAAP